MCVLPE